MFGLKTATDAQTTTDPFELPPDLVALRDEMHRLMERKSALAESYRIDRECAPYEQEMHARVREVRKAGLKSGLEIEHALRATPQGRELTALIRERSKPNPAREAEIAETERNARRARLAYQKRAQEWLDEAMETYLREKVAEAQDLILEVLDELDEAADRVQEAAGVPLNPTVERIARSGMAALSDATGLPRVAAPSRIRTLEEQQALSQRLHEQTQRRQRLYEEATALPKQARERLAHMGKVSENRVKEIAAEREADRRGLERERAKSVEAARARREAIERSWRA